MEAQYFTEGFVIFIVFICVIIITTFLIHNFHLKNPDPKSRFFVLDEPKANKFIFSYGLVTIPFFHLAVIFVFFLIIGILSILIFIFTFGDTFGDFYFFDFNPTILFPWFFNGYAIIEVVAFALAGYRIGFYSEEKGNQIYMNSVLVFVIYTVLSNLMVISFRYVDSISFFDNIMWLISVLELLVIITGTWIGNRKSIEDRSLEKYDKDLVQLPSIKSYMVNIYIVSLIVGVGLFIITSIDTIYKINNSYMYYLVFLTIPVILFYIYALYNLYEGDVSLEKSDEIIIYIDPSTGEIDDSEPLPVLSKVFFVVAFISLIGPIIIKTVLFFMY